MSQIYHQQELNKEYTLPSQKSFEKVSRNQNPSLYPSQYPHQSNKYMSSIRFQPVTNAVPSKEKTYYQPISYVTQTGRTVKRTKSPMISQYPKYQDISENPKYSGIFSADKSYSALDNQAKINYPQNTSSQPVQSFVNNKNIPQVSSFNPLPFSEKEQGKVQMTNSFINENKAKSYSLAYYPTQQLKDSRTEVQAQLQQTIDIANKYVNSIGHQRAYSMKIPDIYSSPLPSNQQKMEKELSFSPSKRVTFNLAKNTYTDVEQIEKRLNQYQFQRQGEENDENLDSKKLQYNLYTIKEFLLTGREVDPHSISFASNNLQSVNNIQNTPTKIIGRSKSPIKSSLKRTSSFTGSPQKVPLNRKETLLNQSPLTNQTNKIINTLEQIQNSLPQDNGKSHNLLENMKSSLCLATNKVPLYNSSINPREKLSSSSILGISKPMQQSTSPHNQDNIRIDYQRATTPPPKQVSNATTYYIQKSPQQPQLLRNLNSNSKGSNLSSATKENENNTQIQEFSNEKQNLSSGENAARKGVIRYPDGSRYNGSVLNNKRSGYGTLMGDNFQVIYQGLWKNDTYHGQGKFFNPLAENLQEDYDYRDFDIALSQYWESYEGEFLEGKLDGYGTLMLTNGEKLVGNFRKGRVNGKGTFYSSKSPALIGTWQDNCLIEGQ